MTELQHTKRPERNSNAPFPPATTREQASVVLAEQFDALRAQQHEMTTEVFAMLRQMEPDGWRHDNVAGGSTFDISTLVRLSNGGLIYVAILHDTGSESDDRPLSDEGAAQKIADALQHGQRAVIEFYSADEVAIALDANPEATLRDIRASRETSNYTFISAAGDNDVGRMWGYMIERAQSGYFESQLESLTHEREAYNYQQQAEHERGDVNERVSNAMKATELYVDALTKMMQRDFECNEGLVTAGELEAALKDVPLDEWLQYAIEIKNALDDVRDNTVVYRQAIIDRMQQHGQEALGRIALVYDMRAILADVDVAELERYQALMMERMSLLFSDDSILMGKWHLFSKLMGQLKYAATYKHRGAEQAASVFIKVMQQIRMEDIDVAESLCSEEGSGRTLLDEKYLGVCGELHELKAHMKAKGWGRADQIQCILQDICVDEAGAGWVLPPGVPDDLLGYITHIIKEAEQSHIHDVSRQLLNITGIVFDIDYKLRFVNGAPRDCSGAWNDGVVEMLNQLMDVNNFRHVHDHIPGKEVAMPPDLSILLQRHALLELLLSNMVSRGGGYDVLEA